MAAPRPVDGDVRLRGERLRDSRRGTLTQAEETREGAWAHAATPVKNSGRSRVGATSTGNPDDDAS